MKKRLGLVLFALLIALPRLSSATIVDDRMFSGVNCGGDCFGLTHHLVVDDLGNLADGTWSSENSDHHNHLHRCYDSHWCSISRLVTFRRHRIQC